MSKDTISDILTCIRNADMANKETVRIGFTNIVEKIVKILLRGGFIKNAREHREHEESFLFLEESSSSSDSEWEDNYDSDDDEDDDEDFYPHRRRIPPPRMVYINPCPCCRVFKRLAEILLGALLWIFNRTDSDE